MTGRAKKIGYGIILAAMAFLLWNPVVARAAESEFEFYYQRIEAVEQINDPKPEGWWDKTKAFVKNVGNKIAGTFEKLSRTYFPGEGEKRWYSEKDANIAYKLQRTKVKSEAHLLELMGAKSGDLSKLTDGQKALLAVYRHSRSQAVKERMSVSYRSKIAVTLSDTTGFDDAKKYPQVENDFWPCSTGRMIQMSSNFFNYAGSEEDAQATFVHEFSHSCDRTVKEFIKPYGKDGRHSCNELTHKRSAFVEGWAEFNEMLDFPSERSRIQNAIKTVKIEKGNGEYTRVDATDASLTGRDLMNVEGVVANIFYRMSSELPDGRKKVFAAFKDTNIYWRTTKMMLRGYVEKNPGDAKALAAILNEATHGKLTDADMMYYLGKGNGVMEFLAARKAPKAAVAVPEVKTGSDTADQGVTVNEGETAPGNPFTAGSTR
ncbi:MAG TPA: hypothetical protein PLP29_14620 [Candidatus Ozemobacteraceae bacterium]|nr:hypothetical protein [Candidatus Ozemobacteraceae bacterium]